MSQLLFASPAEAEAAFYLSIRENDLTRMMAVWSDDDSAVCIHPGAPRLEGRDLIEQSWQEIFEAGPPMEFSISEERITQDAHLAIHLVREVISIDGEVVSVMLATNIYHRLANSWHMMLHHASPEPEYMVEEIATRDAEPIVLH